MGGDRLYSGSTVTVDFINEELEANGCPMKTRIQLDIAVEEILVGDKG